MRSSFVKKCLSVYCLMSFWSGFSYGEEKKEIGLLLIGGKKIGKSATINTIYNVIKDNDITHPLDIITPLRHHNHNVDVSVDAYDESLSGQLIQRFGKYRSTTKFTIENENLKLNIYKAPH